MLNRLRVKPDELRLALLSALAAWAIGCGLLYAPLWTSLEYKVFDLYSVYTAPLASKMPITIVSIDEASSTQMNLRWPYPRTVHADLIDKLVNLGAAVIAFDVQFSEPSTPEEDARLTEAIFTAGNVVLASKYEYHETATARQFLRMDPIVDFTQAGAMVGLTDMDFKGEARPRYMKRDPEAFWLAAIHMLMQIIPDSVEEPGVPPEAMIRYLGPRYTFPYFSYYQVINEDPGITPELFQDAIVLIGRDAGATTDINTAQADAFATPFTMLDGMLTAGVEIHATQIENAMLGDMLEPATRYQNLLIVSLTMLLSLPLFLYWHPLRSSVGALLLGAGVVGTTFWVFKTHHIWAATATPLAGLVMAFVSTGTGSFLTERRRAGEIRGAFSKYVSADVVAEMIAHPERLKLGGQRREISLLFSDLAGFTSLSEKLEPQAVTHVVNMYLNAMTHVIMRHGGTVDKFIGDAVMAFWGAPLDDADHAANAVRTAIAMQQAMHAMQPDLLAYGVDSLHLRIGINSGSAIVGNMGSDLRFDYTALGDSVNLASRLEGANKAYGTPILIASSTAEIVKDRFRLRPVDRVRVKGKKVPVDVFTPCDDDALIANTERLWQLFLARDWQGALEQIAVIRETYPDDRLVTVVELRVKDCQREEPPGDWDGSVGLDKL